METCLASPILTQPNEYAPHERVAEGMHELLHKGDKALDPDGGIACEFRRARVVRRPLVDAASWSVNQYTGCFMGVWGHADLS